MVCGAGRLLPICVRKAQRQAIPSSILTDHNIRSVASFWTSVNLKRTREQCCEDPCTLYRPYSAMRSSPWSGSALGAVQWEAQARIEVAETAWPAWGDETGRLSFHSIAVWWPSADCPDRHNGLHLHGGGGELDDEWLLLTLADKHTFDPAVSKMKHFASIRTATSVGPRRTSTGRWSVDVGGWRGEVGG